jgi:hypothetical protein
MFESFPMSLLRSTEPRALDYQAFTGLEDLTT